MHCLSCMFELFSAVAIWCWAPDFQKFYSVYQWYVCFLTFCLVLLVFSPCKLLCQFIIEHSFSFFRFVQGDFSVECLFNACQSTNECLQFYLKIIARSNEEAGTEATGMRNRVIPWEYVLSEEANLLKGLLEGLLKLYRIFVWGSKCQIAENLSPPWKQSHFIKKINPDFSMCHKRRASLASIPHTKQSFSLC